MKTSDAVAQRIRELLKEQGIKQSELEQATGIPHQTMASLMSSRSDGVNLKTVMLIILGLGITTIKFFDSPLFDPNKLELN